MSFNCPFFWIDAFSARVFGGNPAGVCPLRTWPEDALLQKIAWQNGLAETAFFVPQSHGDYHLRWFTPAVEIDLCGHATLAAAHVLWHELGIAGEHVTFHSQSGPLTVNRLASDRLELNFPSRPPTAVDPTEVTSTLAALGIARAAEVGRARDLFVVLDDVEAVTAVTPDWGALAASGCASVIVTAPGNDCDFVSRFFAPGFGVPEDPVTGSAHCTLIPYWARRLQRASLHARQLSDRGGELWCQHREDRVGIAGDATTYLRGEISI
ncbi:PhzF family phenazine biosynthesis protein [Synoicihabitans lomoniglobus]|uniref:PhzF family phenazine biosynthesis protein n=1 Tax=Synoicihabitans lomoniglobus TaxID=2909285 RepID=A0AAE9ZX39_9BACT|nr:PhzF family phenazine biosynthesis protein [Opitutaceae bacterium LMO-M01]WED65757.1 PhzF family phenazine biosynthesis protein [Opitutaceae bacterium LMO-M01]